MGLNLSQTERLLSYKVILGYFRHQRVADYIGVDRGVIHNVRRHADLTEEELKDLESTMYFNLYPNEVNALLDLMEMLQVHAEELTNKDLTDAEREAHMKVLMYYLRPTLIGRMAGVSASDIQNRLTLFRRKPRISVYKQVQEILLADFFPLKECLKEENLSEEALEQFRKLDGRERFKQVRLR
jgi:hypothetical protein